MSKLWLYPSKLEIWASASFIINPNRFKNTVKFISSERYEKIKNDDIFEANNVLFSNLQLE